MAAYYIARIVPGINIHPITAVYSPLPQPYHQLLFALYSFTMQYYAK